jgi:hypothetical protein
VLDRPATSESTVEMHLRFCNEQTTVVTENEMGEGIKNACQ